MATIRIEDDIHAEFKAYCAMNKITISDGTKQLLEFGIQYDYLNPVDVDNKKRMANFLNRIK